MIDNSLQALSYLFSLRDELLQNQSHMKRHRTWYSYLVYTDPNNSTRLNTNEDLKNVQSVFH